MVDAEGGLAGVVTRNDLRPARDTERDVASVMHADPVAAHAPVVDREHGRVVGVVSGCCSSRRARPAAGG